MAYFVEKGLPLRTDSSPKPKRPYKSALLCIAVLSLIRVLSYSFVKSDGIDIGGDNYLSTVLQNKCQQVNPLVPKKTTSELDGILETISSAAYKKSSIDYLSNAVKIPTISRDGMGPPGEDDRWEVFYKFAAYLNSTFPLVHANLQVERVNTHGLFYTWKGSNPNLKPTLLMAHQDVVPVIASTIKTWTHPPFSGFFDGSHIWGRGSSDDKNMLIAIFEAVELLLKADFVPERTTLISLGFDEESSGYQGAGSLAPFILDRYGKGSIASIVDEGAGVAEVWGQAFAAPGVAEKGAVDVKITIRMPGGHSSVPPKHTSIGVISQLIQLIEEDTYDTFLDEKNPYYSQMVCGAHHAPQFPKSLKHLLEKSSMSSSKKDALAKKAAEQSLFTKYLMTTSIAVDIVAGGEKDNALPEESYVIINHRVNIGESVEDVKAKIQRHAKKIAKKHDLTLQAYEGDPIPSSMTLSTPHELPVAPVTPTSVDGTTAYSVLSGTIRALYGEDMIVTPSMTTGNTDTRFMWELSENIFRFAPGYAGKGKEPKNGMGNIHTVDESVNVENHFSSVKWFTLFIRNMDEAELA